MTLRSPGASRPVILVHGAFHGGWCYVRVTESLRRAGVPVYAPSLTGLADRSHLVGQAGLGTHIADIVNLLHWEGLDDVVLVAHSYGGMVADGVADAVPERIASLVYLDGTFPVNGQSTLDTAAPGPRAGFESLVTIVDGTQVVPALPSAAFGVNAADQAWVDSLLTPMPWAALTEPLVLTGAGEAITDRVAVWSTGYVDEDRLANYRRVVEIQQDAGWINVGIDGGHDLMIDAPDEVARVILDRSQA